MSDRPVDPPSQRPAAPAPPAAGRATRRRHPSAGNLDEPVPVEAPIAAPSPIGFPDGSPFDPGSVRVGPGLTDAAVGRLIGNGEGRKFLELGCGDGSNAVAMALQGARVIVADPSPLRLARARAAAEEHGVKIEFHQADLADLAFIRADLIDVCLAAYSLVEVSDVARVFRQVHRVLRPEAPFVVSLPHPLSLMVTAAQATQGSRDTVGPTVTRSAFDVTPIESADAAGSGTAMQVHRTSDIFTALTRSNFRVDALLEPPLASAAGSPARTALHDWIPATVVLRGRKQGT